MSFYSHNLVSLIHASSNYSRPFDEIVYSYGSTTAGNNDNLYADPKSTKDTLT